MLNELVKYSKTRIQTLGISAKYTAMHVRKNHHHNSGDELAEGRRGNQRTKKYKSIPPSSPHRPIQFPPRLRENRADDNISKIIANMEISPTS